MKIGIITLHDNNYGSALQCYATQCYFKSLGVDSEVIDLAGSIIPFVGYAKTLSSLSWMCLSHIGSAASILKLFKSQRSKGMTLSAKSAEEIHRFNFTKINRRVISEKRLESVARTDEYSFFVSGSDQVWNGARINAFKKFFLRFAPPEKRIAWAASFGGSRVASYNTKRYRKYISEYPYISVREESGSKLVKEMTERDVPVLADPVFLLDAEQWREKSGSVEKKPKSKYIAAFFIDKPSEKAQHFSDRMKSDTTLPIYTLGYHYSKLNAAEQFDGDPMDFLGFLDNAEYILTDSFHAVAFSIIFQKRFYVFERMYTHNQKQSDRITGLLESICLSDRYEPDNWMDEQPCFTAAKRYLAAKQKEAKEFIGKVFGDFVPSVSEAMVWDKCSKCCGCGACADACPTNAIMMRPDKNGVLYPYVDERKCIDCGKCQRICAFSKCGQSIQHAFVASAKDRALISHSASGGIFAVLAKHIIKQRGVVFGASLWIEDGIVKCEHMAVDTLGELWKIQGSKYVQSKTQNVFQIVQNELSSGRKVLFGGTSCQVAALKAYLGKEYDNLYTTDLICHGVPPLSMLQDYIDYQSDRNGQHAVNFRFRVREGRNKPYLTTTTTIDSNGNLHEHFVSLRNSSYYRLFMSNSGYRPSCYNCPFACSHKPADITLGDQYLKDNTELRSCVLGNNEKGTTLLAAIADEISCRELPVEEAIRSHEQLQKASIPSRNGENQLCIYREDGFAKLQSVLNFVNRISAPLVFIKKRIGQ